MLDLAKKVFGSSNERRVRRYQSRVQRINALEPELEALTNEQLRLRTVDLRQRVTDGASLDSVLEEAFATVREAAKRTLGQRHFDVQLVGGIVLHEGAIAEMRTGEGKTLVATLPAYLNALTGKGVHVVTVNDYLAKRDAEWMGQVYQALGLSVGCIVHGLSDLERKRAYQADITYGTNNEYGFDYLRDNMKYALEEMVQRGHNFAIVDEVDSILVDEARTPLIISGPTDDRSDFYRTIHDVVSAEIREGDYEIDEKQRAVTLTEDGNERMEALLEEKGLLEGSSLYDITNVSIVHHVNQALRAIYLYSRDKDYIVKNDNVVLIDEFTGRMMEGRRLSEGLHQAIEAKEGVSVQPENVTLASITFQNYFRLFNKLAGMTGTAATEASEFADIYKLEVVEIPTNRPVQRIDEDDEVYRTEREKLRAVIIEVADAHSRQQPVLVGTASIEKSEMISALLHEKRFVRELIDDVRKILDDIKEDDERRRLSDAADHLETLVKAAKARHPVIPHQVLNARYHEQEALIIAQAGVPGAVTIATNMAGRGTDIQLGGNVDMALEAWLAAEREAGREPDDARIARRREEVVEEVAAAKRAALAAGGTYVVGSERHESRRIDNQLRGRTGRQGDPGRSKFFVSVEDDLMRIFAADRMNQIMKTLGMKEGEAIVHPWMSKALENAQKRVEQRNFEIRKNLLKYDDVINDQRKAIFEQRIEFMESEDVIEVVADMRHELAREVVTQRIPPKAYVDQWDVAGLTADARSTFGLELPIQDWAVEEGIADEEIAQRLIDAVDDAYAKKAASASPDIMRKVEKQVLLQTIDLQWREHLQQLDHLRSVVHLRGYAQRDPLNEFKTEAFALFETLLSQLRADVTRILMNLRVQVDPPAQPTPPKIARESHPDPEMVGGPGPISGGGGPLAAAAGRAAPSSRAAPPRAAPRPAAAPAGAPIGQRDPNDPTTWGRVGRNELCPCGSGKKYKHCHGAATARV